VGWGCLSLGCIIAIIIVIVGNQGRDILIPQ
jgi:hypothetical protein